MTQILTNLKAIIQRSLNVEYVQLGIKGVYQLKSQEDLDLLWELSEGENELSFDFDFKRLPSKNDFKLNQDYAYSISVRITETRSNFFSNADNLLRYILREKKLIDWSSKIILPFDEDLHPDAYKYKKHLIALNRLLGLYQRHAYWDSKRIVLFTHKPVLIPTMADNAVFAKFKQSFDKINIDKFESSIESIESQLDNEEIAEHRKEKKSIFVMESSKIIEKEDSPELRIYKLIERFTEIENSYQNSFNIYIENFSYQRLELELKKDLDYFVKSISDSIGALQSQALGLPIATALVQLSKSKTTQDATSLNYIVLNGPYIALLIFSIFVLVNVYQQYIQVVYIKTSIKRFFNKEALISALKNDSSLKEMQGLLNKRIYIINLYMVLIGILSILIILYSFYELSFFEWLIHCFKLQPHT